MHVAAGVIFLIQKMMMFLTEHLHGEADLVRQLSLCHVGDFRAEKFFGLLCDDDAFACFERRAGGRFLAVTVTVVFAVGFFLAIAFLVASAHEQ